MILKQTAKEGEVLPSVRQISADLSVNPLTVTKAFEGLVDIGWSKAAAAWACMLPTGRTKSCSPTSGANF
ncbi:hypothetical protein [Mesorhizobium sp. M1216]|uniref:hypothetical protein n=1 Tax=Mesorhizobium sp. M1216 TaxID=2957069 RepID=UPI00333A0D3A